MLDNEKMVSNELFNAMQHKIDRMRELENDELLHKEKLSVEDEYKRLEKFEGDVASKVMPELIRASEDKSRTINDDLYNLIVCGRYYNPHRRQELYEWIRTIVFKNDEFVISLVRLDEKKHEFIRRYIHLVKEYEIKNQQLTSELDALRIENENFKEKHKEEQVIQIPEADVKEQISIVQEPKKEEPLVEEQTALNMREEPIPEKPRRGRKKKKKEKVEVPVLSVPDNILLVEE